MVREAQRRRAPYLSLAFATATVAAVMLMTTAASGSEPSWEPGPGMPEPRQMYGKAQCDDDGFYVISGSLASSTILTQSALRYDTTTGWSTLSDMPTLTGRTRPAAVCAGNTIHVLGGTNNGGIATNQHLVYNIGSNTWDTAANVPRSVTGAAVGYWDGRIYLFGGNPGPSAQVDVYNIAANDWSTSTSIPVAGQSFGYTQVGRFVYLVGGWGAAAPGTNLATTLRFDLETETWQSGPTFSSARANLALVATADALYAIGGDADGGTFFDSTNLVERLDLSTWPGGGWQAVPVLPESLSAHYGGFCTDHSGGARLWSVGGRTGGGGGLGIDRTYHMTIPDETCVSPWESGPSVPFGRMRYAKAQCDPETFNIISGVTEAGTVSTGFHRYFPSLDVFGTAPTLPTGSGRNGPAAVCADDVIHVIGGWNSAGNATNQHLVYDSSTGWGTAAAIPRNVALAAIGYWDGRIYVFGGTDGFAPTSQVNVFDTTTGNWSGGPAVPVAGYGFGHTQVGRHMYLVGGWGSAAPTQNLSATLRFDMETGTWQSGPTFSSARADLALIATTEGLYAVGGDLPGGGFFNSTILVERLPLAGWPGGSWQRSGSLVEPVTAIPGGFCTDHAGGARLWAVGGHPGGSAFTGLRRSYRDTVSGEKCLRAPVISSTPGQAERGSSVTVTGQHFHPPVHVRLGTATITPTNVSETQLTFSIPTGAPTGSTDLEIFALGGLSDKVSITVTAADPGGPGGPGDPGGPGGPGGPGPGTGPCTHEFVDIGGDTFENDICWLADEEITRGCNPPLNNRFCPNDFVTRGQMAAFLVRAFGYTDDGGGNLFVDDDGHTFERDIDRLGTAGVTRGCNPPDNDRFCPDDRVTRGQMAAFLVRAFGYTDDGGGNLFVDDDGHTFERDIDRLGTAGVTRGCNPPDNDRFCPNDFVTRGQMAAFLRRAFSG